MALSSAIEIEEFRWMLLAGWMDLLELRGNRERAELVGLQRQYMAGFIDGLRLGASRARRFADKAQKSGNQLAADYLNLLAAGLEREVAEATTVR